MRFDDYLSSRFMSKIYFTQSNEEKAKGDLLMAINNTEKKAHCCIRHN